LPFPPFYFLPSPFFLYSPPIFSSSCLVLIFPICFPLSYSFLCISSLSQPTNQKLLCESSLTYHTMVVTNASQLAFLGKQKKVHSIYSRQY
jgi:hypothetical protein